jgi:molybdopterin synthase catalytic subunit
LPQASDVSIGTPESDDWIALFDGPLPVDEATSWVVRPDCGGVVVFVGTVRDHADGRPGVSELVYEAYARVAEERMAAVVAGARRRWADLGRTVVWHRTGALRVTEAAVVVAVSAPHRDVAFEAARWMIDTVKSSVPVWKQETWAGGRDWGTGAQSIDAPSSDTRTAQAQTTDDLPVTGTAR